MLSNESAPPLLQLDHLVVAATTLSAGVDYLESRLGVPFAAGGQHVVMGTHNALLKLDGSTYLEVIAIDPSLPAPQRKRWFGMDTEEQQAALSVRPRLIHWVCRTEQLDSLQQRYPGKFGRTLAMSRNQLHWSLTVPDDGSLPAAGILPSLIQWPRGQHPTTNLPECNCRLQQLEAGVPNPETLTPLLDELGIAQLINLSKAPRPRLCARIEIPTGITTLD